MEKTTKGTAPPGVTPQAIAKGLGGLPLTCRILPMLRGGLAAAAVVAGALACLLLMAWAGPARAQGLAQTPGGTLDANTLPASTSDLVSGSTSFGERSASAQTFTALNSWDVTSVQLGVSRREQVQDDLSVRLTALDASGNPGTTLASTTVPASAVADENAPPTLLTAGFDDPPAVVAGQEYALVLSSGGIYDWYYSVPLGQYAGGMLMYNDAGSGWILEGSWGDGVVDGVFAIYLDGPRTPEDTAAPELSLPSEVTALATGPEGTSVYYEATATDETDGAVPLECSPASGSTFPVGSTTVSCSATDAAGNEGTGSFEVRVLYDFGSGTGGGGFAEPITEGATNLVKAGAAVPVKFSLGGDFGLGVLAEGYPLSRRVSCDASAPTDPVEGTVAASTSGLRYDAASGQYVYAWKTDRRWAGTCRELVVGLEDGTEHTAVFEFR